MGVCIGYTLAGSHGRSRMMLQSTLLHVWSRISAAARFATLAAAAFSALATVIDAFSAAAFSAASLGAATVLWYVSYRSAAVGVPVDILKRRREAPAAKDGPLSTTRSLKTAERAGGGDYLTRLTLAKEVQKRLFLSGEREIPTIKVRWNIGNTHRNRAEPPSLTLARMPRVVLASHAHTGHQCTQGPPLAR